MTMEGRLEGRAGLPNAVPRPAGYCRHLECLDSVGSQRYGGLQPVVPQHLPVLRSSQREAGLSPPFLPETRGFPELPSVPEETEKKRFRRETSRSSFDDRFSHRQGQHLTGWGPTLHQEAEICICLGPAVTRELP